MSRVWVSYNVTEGWHAWVIDELGQPITGSRRYGEDPDDVISQATLVLNSLLEQERVPQLRGRPEQVSRYNEALDWLRKQGPKGVTPFSLRQRGFATRTFDRLMAMGFVEQQGLRYRIKERT